MDAAVVIVGDEILAGHVRDANTHLIAGRLAALGHGLRRVVVVPDKPDEIAATITTELAEKRASFSSAAVWVRRTTTGRWRESRWRSDVHSRRTQRWPNASR